MPAARDFCASRMMFDSISFFIFMMRSATSSMTMTMYGILRGMFRRSSSLSGFTRRTISSKGSSL